MNKTYTQRTKEREKELPNHIVRAHIIHTLAKHNVVDMAIYIYIPSNNNIVVEEDHKIGICLGMDICVFTKYSRAYTLLALRASLGLWVMVYMLSIWGGNREAKDYSGPWFCPFLRWHRRKEAKRLTRVNRIAHQAPCSNTNIYDYI